MELENGTIFSTNAEDNCIFIRWDGEEYKNKRTPTGKCRNFVAFDSEMVECGFSTMMVIGHPDYYDPTV